MKIAILLLALFVVACGKQTQKSSRETQKVSAYFKASSLKVKVYYEPGAEPYTNGTLPLTGLNFNYWTILEKNLEALFQGRKINPTIVIPKSHSDMDVVNLQHKNLWTMDDVLDLAKKTDGGDSTTFNIYFLNGLAKENPNIIGFHISNTRVIAVFKDVIRNSGTGETLPVSEYVEQMTLVHEIGHALGLVNNGVPMVSDHQDQANGKHCKNTDCVMYYTHEGTTELVKFARQAAQSLSLIMYDDQCLKDTRSY